MGRETKNVYIYPVKISDDIKIYYDKSPAHTGKLKEAVDFVVKEGTPICAALDGKVVDVKYDSDKGGEHQRMEEFGNFIEIEHGNGEYSEYEHLTKNGVTVKIGDYVKKGQVIGYSGVTGWIANLGPHLHFMVGKYEADNSYVTLKIVWEKNY